MSRKRRVIRLSKYDLMPADYRGMAQRAIDWPRRRAAMDFYAKTGFMSSYFLSNEPRMIDNRFACHLTPVRRSEVVVTRTNWTDEDKAKWAGIMAALREFHPPRYADVTIVDEVPHFKK